MFSVAVRMAALYCVCVCVCVCHCADASSSQPSPGQDLLYVLISAGLGWQAWNERQALLGEAQEQQ